MARFLSVIFLGIMFSPAASGLEPAQTAEENRIVAVVNQEVITQTEFNRALAPIYFQLQASLSPEELHRRMGEVHQQVLEQLIDEKLMLQEARNPRQVEVAKGKIGVPPVIEVSEQEVQEVLEKTRGRFQSPEEFLGALQQQGLIEEDLRARFREQITIQKLISREIRSRVAVSPAEITSTYEANRDRFRAPPAVQVATLLIRPKDNLDMERAQALSEGLHRRLQQKEDFYELAKRYSDGLNAQMGGRIGFLEKGKSRKEIEEALFRLKPGEFSPVIQTPAGFHLFLVEAIRPERQSDLAEVQEDIKYELLEEKSAARYKEWIARLREDSYISVK